MTISRILASTVLLGALSVFAPLSYAAKTCELTIEGNDAMQYNKKSLEVPADCTEVKLTLTHTGKLPAAAMGHNWVLTETSVFQAVDKAGMSAGLQNNYVPKDDARVIAHTKVVGGGESTSVTFPTSKLKKGGDYTFFCSFPGHASVMKGKLTFG
ncbi:MAG TPA: azurin [Steroidobacter sp.]|nr:azurin [Steroidobacter sp.]